MRRCRTKIDRIRDWSKSYVKSWHLRHEKLQETKRDFDFQWSKISSPQMRFSGERIAEFLSITKLNREFFKGKSCLDAGCGTGRWTYAMLRLDAKVDSFDISPSAIESCKSINPNAKLMSIYELQPNPKYDFVLCWGVLHHLPDPELGFKKVSRQVRNGGILHVMVYNRKAQAPYEEGRRLWPRLDVTQRLAYCRKMILLHGGNLHGWWDALNPEYNFSYSVGEIETWFKNEGFEHIILTTEGNINMRAIRH